MKQRIRTLFMLLVAGLLCACGVLPNLDDVLPDERRRYEKSETLPDLEVPPDLTADASRDGMDIPGEQQASLSSYQRQRAGGAPGAGAIQTRPDAVGNDQWVSVRGHRYDIWPDLRAFFQDRGYTLNLDDAELGVLETDWSEPVTEAGAEQRHRIKIFSEPGGDESVTVLIVSSEQQQRFPDGEWIDREGDGSPERQVAGQMNLYFSERTASAAPARSGSPAATPSAAAPARARAELMNAGDGKIFLAMPEEFTVAWHETEAALQRAGLSIDRKDPAQGLYYIRFYDPAGEGEEGGGWFSKLAFWKDDEEPGRTYQISVTGVGDKTELVVLNENGEWSTGEDAGRILGIIQNQYNTR